MEEARSLHTQTFGNACVQYGRIYGPGSNNRYDETIKAPRSTRQWAAKTASTSTSGDPPMTAEDPNARDRVRARRQRRLGLRRRPGVRRRRTGARRANAVVVTVNYRLGIFGFLDVPQLKGGASGVDQSGNYALLDLIKSLQFVRDNIERFGGDARNVTLMGQSAGAINVYALQTSPLVMNARRASCSAGAALGRHLAGHQPAAGQSADREYAARGHLPLAGQRAAGAASSSPTASAPIGRGPINYIASQPPAATSAPYLRSKTPSDPPHGTLLTRLAPVGLWRLGSDPRRHRSSRSSHRCHQRGCLPARAGARGQYARRGQAVPELPRAPRPRSAA